MALALSIIGIAFAAFCVWLTVRIVNRRERWAKRTLAVVVGLPLGYVVSFGPACWITSRIDIGRRIVPTVFHPVLSTFFYDPSGRPYAIANWYAELGAADGWRWHDSMRMAWDAKLNKVVGGFEWNWTHPGQVSDGIPEGDPPAP